MNEDDLVLRNLTYARFVELGRAPTAGELAAVAGRGPAQIQAGWERLHAEHALVLNPATGIRATTRRPGDPRRRRRGRKVRRAASGRAAPGGDQSEDGGHQEPEAGPARSRASVT